MPCPYTLHHHTVRARHALPLHHPTPSHRTGTACRAPYTRLPQSVPHHTVRARHAVPLHPTPTRAPTHRTGTACRAPTSPYTNTCTNTPYGHGMPCPLHHPTPIRAPSHRTLFSEIQRSDCQNFRKRKRTGAHNSKTVAVEPAARIAAAADRTTQILRLDAP